MMLDSKHVQKMLHGDKPAGQVLLERLLETLEFRQDLYGVHRDVDTRQASRIGESRLQNTEHNIRWQHDAFEKP